LLPAPTTRLLFARLAIKIALRPCSISLNDPDHE
jgi:hypothetical protein